MVKGKDTWLIGDENGKIYKVKQDTLEYSEVTNFHSGAVTDLAVL